MRNSTAVKEDAQRLLDDLRALAMEAEKLIENSSSEMTGSTLRRLQQRFSSAQHRFSQYYDVAKDKTVAGAKYADEIVHANPYQTVGVAAGIGLVLGFLLGRSVARQE